MKQTAAARELPLGVGILGHCAGFEVPPTGGTVWVNPGADVDALPYVLRELIASATRTALRACGAGPQSLAPPGSLTAYRVVHAARQSSAQGAPGRPARRVPPLPPVGIPGLILSPSTTNTESAPQVSFVRRAGREEGVIHGKRNSCPNVHGHGQRAI